MGRIQVLAADVAGRIAAGEVVERPASVVKELVDNALDAGARRIRVELAEGGAAGIVVSDDGCGMDPEDAVLAFARHATSKIRAFSDLTGLATLGFRGEALPSIGAVAKVELLTRPAEATAGTMVRLAGGGAAQAVVAPAAPGTRVAVEDLFFNMPARRASLRGGAQELAAGLEAVTAAAVARPDVAFRVMHNGREVLGTPGDGDLLSAVVALWGPDVARGMLPVAGRDGGWEVAGLCGTPTRARGNRALQFISVDGRPVRAEHVRGAVEGAYRNLLMVHRYPVFILRLSGGADLYDPNVHPSKREVRFLRVEAVRDLCHHAVRASLRQARLIPDVLPAGGTEPAPRASAVGFGFRVQAPEGPPGVAPPAGWPVRDRDPEVRAEEAAAEYRAGAASPGNAADLDPPAPARLPALRPLGQVADAYIVAEGPDGLYLIDQHAAHERVFFERLGARPPGAAQALLQPVPVELGEQQWGQWEQHREELTALGLVAEEFGDSAILVRAIPAGLGGAPGSVVAALLAEVAGQPHGPRAARLALAACKAAIKAGQPLDAGDLHRLLAELGACRDPYTCPHGRPTLLHLGLGDMERHFGRR